MNHPRLCLSLNLKQMPCPFGAEIRYLSIGTLSSHGRSLSSIIYDVHVTSLITEIQITGVGMLITAVHLSGLEIGSNAFTISYHLRRCEVMIGRQCPAQCRQHDRGSVEISPLKAVLASSFAASAFARISGSSAAAGAATGIVSASTSAFRISSSRSDMVQRTTFYKTSKIFPSLKAQSVVVDLQAKLSVWHTGWQA